MTDNPINKIEDQIMWMDMGRQAYLIYKGAIEEGASITEAMKIVQAFYAGMFKGAKSEDDEAE